MSRGLVQFAKRVYRATPIKPVRQLGFSLFCRMMRGRQVRTVVRGSTFDLDLGEMIDMALYLDEYERDVTAALEGHCRAGMRVLDIGANIGAHTLTLGRLVTASGAVFAFEPSDFAFRKLRRNLALNHASHIHAFQLALGDENRDRQPIAFRSSWRTDGGRVDAPGEVDFVRLDDWRRRTDVDGVGLIKIDVDGNEFGALSGGLELIQSSRPVIVMEAVWPHFADPRRNPFTMLASLGYRFLDAKTGHEYRDAQEIQRLFREGDTAMTISVNLVARPS